MFRYLSLENKPTLSVGLLVIFELIEDRSKIMWSPSFFFVFLTKIPPSPVVPSRDNMPTYIIYNSIEPALIKWSDLIGREIYTIVN